MGSLAGSNPSKRHQESAGARYAESAPAADVPTPDGIDHSVRDSRLSDSNPSYKPLRLAYADPPYPGQAKRHYGDHPDYAGEVDHRDLVHRLVREFDGWALSTSAAALQNVLVVCPPDVRIGVWNRTNSVHPGNRGNWWWSWEPVIFSSARPPQHPTRDVLSCHTLQGFLGNTITGEKPQLFCRWMFALLGAEPGDELADLFPGSNAVSRAWKAFNQQLVIG